MKKSKIRMRIKIRKKIKSRSKRMSEVNYGCP